jgi:hypothetical protein
MCGPGPCTSPTPCGGCERGAPLRAEALGDAADIDARPIAQGEAPDRARRSLVVLTRSIEKEHRAVD